MGCHFLLQGIFPIQGSNPGFLQVFCVAGGFFTTEPLGKPDLILLPPTSKQPSPAGASAAPSGRACVLGTQGVPGLVGWATLPCQVRRGGVPSGVLSWLSRGGEVQTLVAQGLQKAPVGGPWCIYPVRCQ